MFMTLDGTVAIQTYKRGKLVSSEKLDGELVLKLLMQALESGLAEAGKQ
jgi:hypothetical protein